MSNRISGTHRIVAGVAMIVALAASGARAQDTQPDPRWQAWTGCWRTTADGARELGTGMVCVTPDGGKAVTVSTIVGGKVMERTTVNADGASHPNAKDGCSGTQSARFSGTGNRVYLSSEQNCGGGLVRKSNGIMSLTQTGEWLDVQGSSGKDGPSGVYVTRYTEMTDLTGVPAEIASALPARTTVSTIARSTAMAPLSLGDIADASIANEAGTVQAWLVERTKGYTLNLDGSRLAKLADQGVPPQVIDVLVALAYPKQFVMNAGQPETRPAETRARSSTYYASPFGWGYSRYGYSSCSFGYTGYGYGYYDFYSPYSCFSPYYGYRGYGYGYGYGGGYYPAYGYGYYPGGTVIVVQPASSPAAPHGRVVKGEGYTSGNRGQSGSSSGGSSSSSGSSSSAGSTGSTGSSSGSSSSGGDRTAHKKP